MGRRERRHPNADPVGELQEEAQWSGFTRHIRAANQGKFIFRAGARAPRAQDRSLIKYVAAAALLGGLTIALVGFLVDWLLRHS